MIVDFGRELYVPWRLAEGDALFRDVVHFNGPLSPYLNAALFRRKAEKLSWRRRLFRADARHAPTLRGTRRSAIIVELAANAAEQ